MIRSAEEWKSFLKSCAPIAKKLKGESTNIDSCVNVLTYPIDTEKHKIFIAAANWRPLGKQISSVLYKYPNEIPSLCLETASISGYWITQGSINPANRRQVIQVI